MEMDIPKGADTLVIICIVLPCVAIALLALVAVIVSDVVNNKKNK